MPQNLWIQFLQLRSYCQSLVYSVADHSKCNKVLLTEFNCFFKNNYRNQHVYDSEVIKLWFLALRFLLLSYYLKRITFTQSLPKSC